MQEPKKPKTEKSQESQASPKKRTKTKSTVKIFHSEPGTTTHFCVDLETWLSLLSRLISQETKAHVWLASTCICFGCSWQEVAADVDDRQVTRHGEEAQGAGGDEGADAEGVRTQAQRRRRPQTNTGRASRGSQDHGGDQHALTWWVTSRFFFLTKQSKTCSFSNCTPWFLFTFLTLTVTSHTV